MEPTLETLIANRPIAERPSDPASCPYCGSRELIHHGTSTTLLGWAGGSVDEDPNHRHESWTCRACRGAFTRETKSGSVWYTDPGPRVHAEDFGAKADGVTDDSAAIQAALQAALAWAERPLAPKLLRGVAGCFESVTYTCAHCGGDVTRRHTTLDGVTPTHTLSYNFETRKRGHRTFYGCASCHREVEADE